MDKKFLIKFKDDVVRGPFTESEIDDMIYESVLNGEEQIRAYPEGDWTDIGKIDHFYDAFLGAFEIQKNTNRDQKDTFVDSPTQTGLKEEGKTGIEQAKIEKTVVKVDKDQKNAEQEKEATETQLYTREDIKEISDSLIKRKNEGIIDPDQKSPIIPQAVIVSLEGPEKQRTNPLIKLAIIAGSILAVIAIVIMSSKSNRIASSVININGVKFEKAYIEIKLPAAEVTEYNPKEAKKLRDEAIDLIKQDDLAGYQKAAANLLRSFELDTANSSTLSYLAYSYSMLYYVSKRDAEYLNALKAIISRSEKIDPNIQTLSMAKIAYTNVQKDYGAGITTFNELLNSLKDPMKINNDVLLVTAEAAIGSNDYNSAFQIISRINKADGYKNPRSYYLEGIVRINNKELELAANAFNKALEINPNHFSSKVKLLELGKDANLNSIFGFLKTNYKNMNHDDASICLYLLGNIMVQNNDVEKAKYFYEKSLEFSNENVKAMIAYEQLGGNVGKYKKDNFLTSVPSAETGTFLMRGDELFHLQKYRDSSLQYRMAASLDPQNAMAWFKLGEAYRMTYEYSKAIDSYNESLKLDKMNINALVKLARVQTDLYKFKDAADNLKKAQEIDPENPDVLFSIGYLNDKRNAGDAEVIKYYHRAVANDFSHVDSNFALGKKTFDYERYEEAKLSFEKVLAKQPDHFESYMYITRILAKTDHISKAERYVDNLEKTFPDVAEIDTGLAQAYMDIADYNSAETELKKALKKNKYSIPTLKTYAELCEKLGRTKDALGYYETIAIIAPYYLDAINQKANMYCSLGQTANCEQELTRLVQASPQFPKAYYTLGKMYFKENQLENAEFALNSEIQNNPYIRDSYILLGDVYIKANKTQKAVELFQRMLAANRKDPYALLGLAAASYAARDFATAEAYITQARHLDPSISRIYFLECKLYFDQKMYAESRNSCQEFLKRAPDDFDSPEVRDIIGKISK
ncbi:MAG: tetratricopeptide repeat protein [bacterium]